MRAVWKTGLGLTLGLLLGRASAEEVQWRPVAPRPAAAAATPAPAASLGMPVPVSKAASPAAAFDSQVRPVGFVTPDQPIARTIIRAQSQDPPKPMPPGPPGDKDKDKEKVPELHKPGELKVETLAPPSFGPDKVHAGPVVGPCVGDCCGVDCCPPCCCVDDCCGSCFPWFSPCGDGNRWYGSAEYLLWFVRGFNVPPLVTTGPPSTLGVLGANGTQVLVGDAVNYEAFSGGRFALGYWFCDSQLFGLEGSFLFLSTNARNFVANSDTMGNPVISRPFVDAVTGRQTIEPVAFPGESAGGVAAHATTQLWGAEILARTNPWCGSWWKVGLLGGFRFLSLEENLSVTESLTTLGDEVTNHTLSDSFGTHNRFYGGELGLATEFRVGRWFLDTRAKVALGGTRQTAHISGSEVDTNLNTGQQVRFNSGLLALASNSGRFSRDQFSVVPEVGLNLGYNVNDCLRLYVGYTFVYWNNVVRPGAAIDTTVNTSQLSGGALAGPARPAFAFKNTDFWAHGVNFGLELRY